MDEKMRKKIESKLEWFETKVDETDEHFNELERLGRFDPTSPYFYKYDILFFLEYFQSDNSSYLALKSKYDHIVRKLETVQLKRGSKYRKMLFEYLLKDTKWYFTYHGPWFADPEDIGFHDNTGNDLLRWDQAEFLLLELKTEFDLRVIEEKVREVHEAGKKEFIEKIDGIMKQSPFPDYPFFPFVDYPWYPERFWWHHPGMVFEGF